MTEQPSRTADNSLQIDEELDRFDSSEDTPADSICGGELSKMKTPYYSYHVDKSIKSVSCIFIPMGKMARPLLIFSYGLMRI